MDSSPSKTLTKLLEEIISRCTSERMPPRFDFSFSGNVVPHLQTILAYVSTLGVDPDFSLRMDEKSFYREVWDRMSEPLASEEFTEIVASFMKEVLKELFKVPKIQQLPHKNKTLKKNELVPVFIGFLLQLLDHSRWGRITMRKELRFLITILGDAPFRGADEVEEVENLLAEFEAVANKAGSLVLSLIFAPVIEKFVIADEVVLVLLEHTDVLKIYIIKFLLLLAYTAPKTSSTVGSLFILDSLLYDLEDLMNREDGRIVDHVKDQIKILHQGLMLSQSLIKDINVPRCSEVEELKEPVMRIRDVAYEAEYLIKSFSVGDAPCWYLTARLPHVINKIKLTGRELQEIKKNMKLKP